MKTDRRDFIKFTLATLAFSSCLRETPVHTPSIKLPTETIYFGYGTEPEFEADLPRGLKVITENTLEEFPLEFDVHGIEYSKALDLMVFVPKLGKTSWFRKGQGPLTPFKPEAGKYFYGHGAIDEKRGVFYSAQSASDSVMEKDQRNIPGIILIHALDDFRVIGKFSSGGKAPHDITIWNDRLVVCNGGKNPNVAFIDLDKKSLIKKFDSPKGDYDSFGHLQEVDATTMIVATASMDRYKPCGTYSLTFENGLKPFTVPDGMDKIMIGQILSLAVYDGHVLGTCPATGYVFMWKISGEFVAVTPVISASSLVVTPNLQGVIVGSGNHTRPLQLIKLVNGNMILQALPWKETRTGAHSLMVRS